MRFLLFRAGIDFVAIEAFYRPERIIASGQRDDLQWNVMMGRGDIQVQRFRTQQTDRGNTVCIDANISPGLTIRAGRRTPWTGHSYADGSSNRRSCGT